MTSTVKWLGERTSVLQMALELVERGLVHGRAGNVSLRLKHPGGRDLIAITPTSRHYDSLAAADIPVLDLEGQLVDGRLTPSSELKLHIAVYGKREDVGAVIHTHSVHASALAVAGLGIPAVLEEEVAFLGGDIKAVQFRPSGSEQLANNAVRALLDRNAVILANHGAVGVGRTLREALDACELLEKAAIAYLWALAIGRVKPLGAQAVNAARKTFKRSQSLTED